MFKWTGGTLGYGVGALNNLGTMNVSGPAGKTIEAVFNNTGTLNYGGSGGLAINWCCISNLVV